MAKCREQRGLKLSGVKTLYAFCIRVKVLAVL